MTSAHEHPQATHAGPGGHEAPGAALAPTPEEEFAGNKRTLHPWEGWLLAALAIGFTVFHMIGLNFYPMEPLLFRAIHVGWGAAIGFMLYAPLARGRQTGVPWYDWLLIAASIACAAYVTVELDGLLFRAGAQFTPGDVVVGFVGTVIVLEFARRTAGLALPIIAALFIVYSFVGPWMPGVLEHKGFNIDRFFTYIYSEYGIFGVTTQVSSTYIILFVTFAAFLNVSKVGDYINDLCNALFGWARGGPAKAAVASGVLVGHHLRLGGGQRRRLGHGDHPDDAQGRLRQGNGGGDRGDLVHRRPDHAAGDGRRRLPDGRDHRHPVRRDRPSRRSCRRCCSTSPAGCTSTCTRSGSACADCRARSCRRSAA